MNNKDKSLALVVNGIYGPNQLGHSNSYLGAIDPIFTFKPGFVPNVTLASEYLYASETGQFDNGHSATWQGFAAVHRLRLECMGIRDPRRTLRRSRTAARTGAHQTLWEVTQTFTYKVPDVTGLLVRAEYRHDNSNAHVFTNNNFVEPCDRAPASMEGSGYFAGRHPVRFLTSASHPQVVSTRPPEEARRACSRGPASFCSPINVLCWRAMESEQQHRWSDSRARLREARIARKTAASTTHSRLLPRRITSATTTCDVTCEGI